jgi:hypothetical protein
VIAIEVQAPTSTYKAIFDLFLFLFFYETSFFRSKFTIFKETSITNIAFNFVLTLGAIEDDILFLS